MCAQKVLLRSGNYRETARYANSDIGNVEQLLQDLQSQVLVEKEKRRIAEHRADDLEKQLKDLQELTRYELSMEVDRRRDAERRNHDLELQLMRVEAEGRGSSAAADEQLLSREQLLLRKGRSTLLPVDRMTSDGRRNLTGMDRVEKGDKVSLRRFASLSHPTIRNHNISSSSYNNSHRSDDNDDEEWQFTVRHNERILKNSKRKSTKLTRNRFPEKQHNLQKSTSSVSTERRNIVTHFAADHNEIQGNRPTAEHVSWRSGSVRERTQSAGQVNSGQLVAGLTHVTEEVSKREENGNTRGAEHASKGGADSWGAEQTSTKVRASNWSTSAEKSEDELRRAASLVDVSKDRMKEGKRSLRKKVLEAENEDIAKEVHQDSVMTTISQKDSTDVTDVLNSTSPSSSHTKMKSDIYADPAFKTHHQRTVFWQQVASSIVQQQMDSPQVQSFPGDRTHLSEETATSTTTKLPSQGIMKLKAKCESTPNYSEV